MIVFFPAHDWKKKFSLRLAPRSSLSPVSLPGLHSLLCRSVALSLIHTPLGFSLTPSLSLSLSPSIPNVFPPVCVCLLLQYLLQSCSRGGRGIVEDICYERRRDDAGMPIPHPTPMNPNRLTHHTGLCTPCAGICVANLNTVICVAT
jgi:hypothetical protein